ncbi:MAG: carboxypeptidase regulatory-like domain-containing protein, partial [Planctomycetaceae bacterium]
MTTSPGRFALAVAAILLVRGPLAGQATGQQEASDGPAVVGGRIVDHETGLGLAGAIVALHVLADDSSQPLVGSSDEDGRFEFEDVPPGSYSLTVASLGYQAFSDGLEIEGETDVRLVIRLSALPLRLEPIVVVTARRPEFMAGFEQRRARARLHTAFFTAAEIEAQNPRVLSDLFVMVPGAYVEPGLMTRNPLGNVLTVAGGGCTPDVWVNGFLAGNVPYDQIFQPDQIEAVELYT